MRSELAIGRRVLVWALAVTVSLAGCATIRAGAARNTGQLLTEAGFRTEPADTPAKLADLHAMPPLRLVARSQAGDLVYAYADPYHCGCLYLGGPAERAQYERLAARREIVRAQREATERGEGWSPWWWR